MMSEADAETVKLTVSTAAPLNAIGQLAIHFPQVLHVEAWRVMTAEISKRELRMPAKPIVLAQRHYDTCHRACGLHCKRRGPHIKRRVAFS
jgi:hypothetical protein